jgi:DNA polymerase III gamma/tau subunit
VDAIAARRPEWVFPYVARLVDAGADLAEFINGVGETLRALLILRTGAQPAGLTEALRSVIERNASRFEAGDVLRMLQLLQDAETAIRRNANPRLAVEGLLLRFTLLDRTVELGEVLQALGGAGPANRGEPRRAETKRDEAERAARAPTPELPPSRPPAVPPSRAAGSGSLTVELLLSLWPAIRDHVARKSRMIAAELEHARPVQVAEGEVTVLVAEVRRPILEKNRSEIESAVAAVAGAVARVTFRAEAGGAPDSPPAASTGKRLDQQGERDQRLKVYRAKDQSLDAVAEALDLELLD